VNWENEGRIWESSEYRILKDRNQYHLMFVGNNISSHRSLSSAQNAAEKHQAERLACCSAEEDRQRRKAWAAERVKSLIFSPKVNKGG
jgi:hypothetical protein